MNMSGMIRCLVQVNHCLMSGGDFAPSVDFSMRQDANKVIQSGKRIVQCMIRLVSAFRLHAS